MKITPWFDSEDKRNYRSVLWNVTRQCTLDCPFCPFHEKDSDRWIDNGTVLMVASHLVDAILKWQDLNLDYAQVTLFGGEPTCVRNTILRRSVDDISWALKKLNTRTTLNMYTNLTGDTALYAFLIQECKLDTLLVSWHDDFPDGWLGFCKRLYDLFIEMKVPKKNVVVLLPVTGEDDDFQKKIDDLDSIEIQHNEFPLYRCKQHIESPEQSAVMSIPVWKDLVHNNKNCFNDWTCMAGTNHTYIECNGDIFPCQGIGHAVWTGKKDKSYCSGSILKDAPLFPLQTGLTCPQKSCRFELEITKYKEEI